MENATSLNFGGPAGGWAPGKAPSHQESIAHGLTVVVIFLCVPDLGG